jgi:hypothetical protein
MPNQGVKEASTKTLPVPEGPSFAVALDVEGPADAAPPQFSGSVRESTNGDEMGVLIYIVLTVLIFGLLGLVQRLVEGL